MWAHLRHALPPATILEKIAALDSEGPAWIMDRSEELQRREHARPFVGRVNWKAFMQGVKDAFSLSARPLPKPGLPDDSLNESWKTVGDYIRMAIRDYMKERRLSPSVLGLSDDEKQALTLITLKDKNYPALDL